MDNDKKKEYQLSVEVPEDMAYGTYANMSAVSNSATEFIFDFMQIIPGQTKTKVKSRIVMTPAAARAFYNALGKNLQQYEAAIQAAANPNAGSTIRFDQIYPKKDDKSGDA